MIQIKSILTHTYSNVEIPFANNAAIINTIEEKYYLYEILQFLTIQFEMCMNIIGSPTEKVLWMEFYNISSITIKII